MMNSDHISLLIAAARKRYEIACVDHLARRADQPVEHWRRVALHLCDLGYAESYDDGQNIYITDDGFFEAKRLFKEQQHRAARGTATAAPPKASSANDTRCKRCDRAPRPTARFCPQCGSPV
jgi:hypothetical protein